MSIRFYTIYDYPMISSWWEKANEIGPLESMIPIDSTFILELNGIPTLCVSLYLTNITEYCLVENFIGNPEIKGVERRAASHTLLRHLEHFAQDKGYKRLFCLAHKGPLKTRYSELGFTMTDDNVASFCKVIGE